MVTMTTVMKMVENDELTTMKLLTTLKLVDDDEDGGVDHTDDA